MTDQSVKVQVRGLRELGTAFGKLDRVAADELKDDLLGVAQDVVDLAASRVPSISGAAAGSIKAKASTRGAGIAFGGTAAPYFPWLDFGGSVGRGHQPRRAGSGAIRRPWLGAPVGEGRYVYPAISEKRAETADAIDAAVKRAAQRAGFDTKEGL